MSTRSERSRVDPSPRIGVAGAARTDSERVRFEKYVEAVAAVGAHPVPLLVGSSNEGALEDLDGLVLTGGRDINPAEYEESMLPGMHVDVDGERDASELPLARAAVQDDLPLLAICRGVQVVNVALGGTLYQDLDVQRTGRQAWSHDQTKSCRDAAWDAEIHTVAIAHGSRLSQIVGTESLGVNTFHHQSIKDLAPGLIVTARSIEAQAPGLIEAVEAPRHRFLVGVQWHPERMWQGDEPRQQASRRLFAALVHAARQGSRAGHAGGILPAARGRPRTGTAR